MAASVELKRVIKRDGFEQSFDRLRLRDSIASALTAVGQSALLAQQFAETVWVRTANPLARVESSQLAAEVVAVLRLYECADAAAAFLHYRQHEEQQKEDLRVFGEEGGQSHALPWDRARCARSLLRELYVESQVARDLARRVERRLLALGCRHLTARLVSALAENEARVLGLLGGSLQQEGIGLSRRQLRSWLGGACMPATLSQSGVPSLGPQHQDPRPLLGGEILARFAVEDILSEPQREAWKVGHFDFVAVDDWMRPLRLWLHPGADEDETSFWQRVRTACLQAHEVQVFWPAGKKHGALSRLAPQWLPGPGVQLRCATSDVDLAQAWAEQGIWHQLPLRAWLQSTTQARQSLHQKGRSVLQWQPPQRLPAQQEQVHRQLDQGVVLNLLAPAATAGAFHVDAFLNQVADGLQLACSALKLLCRRARADSYPRVALLPCGLETACKLLFPDDALRLAHTQRLVLALRDRFERAARQAGLRWEHTLPPRSQAAAARLAERSGLLRPQDFRSGWMLGNDSVAMVSLAFDTAPWLELPTSTPLPQALLARFIPTPPAPSTGDH